MAPPKPADPTKDGEEARVADEFTPLLNAPESGNPTNVQDSHTANGEINGRPKSKASTSAEQTTSQEEESDTSETPLPYKQIIFLCYASLAEPVAYFSIFPFINEMIHVKGQSPFLRITNQDHHPHTINVSTDILQATSRKKT